MAIDLCQGSWFVGTILVVLRYGRFPRMFRFIVLSIECLHRVEDVVVDLLQVYMFIKGEFICLEYIGWFVPWSRRWIRNNQSQS